MTKTQRKYTADEIEKINCAYWDMSVATSRIAKNMRMSEVTVDRLIMTKEDWEKYKEVNNVKG